MIVGVWKTGEVTVTGQKLSLRDSLKVRNHSPTGFMWGYGGSGPAQLSLALLLYFRDRTFAERHYQDLKWEIVSSLPQEDFAIPVSDVLEWIHDRETEGGSE